MIDRDIDWRMRFKWSYIPEALRGLTLADWPPQSEAGHRALATARHFVATLPQRLQLADEDLPREDRTLIGVGMSLIGSHGTGKTELACAILTEAAYAGASVCYVRADDLITAMVLTARDPKTEQEEKLRYQAEILCRRVRLSSVAVVDDLGKEHKTDSRFAQRKINTLLRGRHGAARPTIVTSNEPIPKWVIYDDALPSFAAQALPTTLLIGADLRVRR
jgi:DNA replication protein DnaC